MDDCLLPVILPHCRRHPLSSTGIGTELVVIGAVGDKNASSRMWMLARTWKRCDASIPFLEPNPRLEQKTNSTISQRQT